MIRNLCRFLQPGLISSMTFEEKIDLSDVNHKKLYKLVLYLICNDWKQILRLEAPSKIILKTFYYKNKGTRKIKSFQKLLYNKEIYVILQSSNAKYNKPFKLYIYIIRVYIYIYIYIYIG